MMAAVTKLKYRYLIHVLFLIFLNLIFFSTQMKAYQTCHQCFYQEGYYCTKRVTIPAAFCTAGNTRISLPTFICCQLLDRRGAQIWGNTWVAGSCKKAHPDAVYDFGCNKNSPVFGPGRPIVGCCQFLHVSGYC